LSDREKWWQKDFRTGVEKPKASWDSLVGDVLGGDDLNTGGDMGGEEGEIREEGLE
jgi:hypothetical protein